MTPVAQALTARIEELAESAPSKPALIEVADNVSPRVKTIGSLARDILMEAEELKSSTARYHVICHPAEPGIETVTIVLAALCAKRTILPYPRDMDAATLSRVLAQAGLADRTSTVKLARDYLNPRQAQLSIRLSSWTDTPAGDLPSYMLMTSGSTGTPKLAKFWNYKYYDKHVIPDVVFRSCNWRSNQTQLHTLPISHIAPFSSLLQGVLDGNEIIIARGLTPRGIAEAVREHQVSWMLLTPDEMRKLLPIVVDTSSAFSSLRALIHTALPCPQDLKWRWIDSLGAERIYEMYGGTEGIGVTVIRGSEWVTRPGSVGRGLLTRIKILDEEGKERRAGEVGRVFMRSFGSQKTQTPWLKSFAGGFLSLGDIGWVDDQGYLFLLGREEEVDQ